MPDVAQTNVLAAVQRYLDTSLGTFLTKDDAGELPGTFSVPEVLATETPVTDAEGRAAVVPWSYEGIHTGDWPHVGSATGHHVTVRGVTFVHHWQELEADADAATFRHVVDWADAVRQVGLTMTGRPVVGPPS